MKKITLFLILLVQAVTTAFAQGEVVQGTVLDTQNLPLIGATILVEGSQVGTVTDFDGKFSLRLPEGAEALVVSYMGYQSKTQPIGVTTQFNIVLESEAMNVDAVVVVGYGTQKKVSVTGAVAAIDSDEILKTPSSSVEGALVGRLPGLTITQSSGQPGEEDFTMRLRGISTTNGQNPLVLVDGVPREESLSLLDPNEIESISILKDASATAVFGVRGANGVVLVTTKMGQSEKPSLNVSYEFGIQTNTRDFDMPDSWEFAVMRNEALTNDGLAREYSNRQIELYKSGEDPLYYPNTDWYDLFYRKSAPRHRLNVSYSGKTDRVSYFANVGYVNQQGMYKTESKEDLGYDASFKLDRYNFRSNLNIKLNSWIKTDVKLAGYISSTNSPYESYNSSYHYFARLYNTNATIPNMWEAGTIGPDGVPLVNDTYFTYSSSARNPYAFTNYCGSRNTTKVNINTSLALDFDLESITEGLTAKVMYSFDTNGSTIRLGTYSQQSYDETAWNIREVSDGSGGYTDEPIFIIPDPLYPTFNLTQSSSFRYQQNVQIAMNYSRVFDDVHNVTGMLLGQYDDSEALSGDSNALLPYRRLGVSARATYNYDDRYLAELNMGYNGSEQFAKGHRFGLFPAMSLGWVVSNEEFMKHHPIFNNLKLRMSYGKVGSDSLGSDRFLYMDNLEIYEGSGTTDHAYHTSLADGSYIYQTQIGNPDLTWETAIKSNFGIDLGLYNNTITFSMDYFTENRTNILIQPETQPTVGGINIITPQNLGEVYNHGVETTIAFQKRLTKDWFVGAGANLTWAKNERIYMAEMPLGDDYAYPYRSEGFQIGQTWGYLIDWDSPGNGYFVSQQELDQYSYSGTQPRLGDFVYRDLNNDGIIDDKDTAPIGYGSVPNITYGFNLSVGYKNFDLSALFYGVGQVSKAFSGNGVYEYAALSSMYLNHHKQAWTLERYANGEEITYPALSSGGTSSSTQANNFFIENTSYLRLKNLEIGYNIPQQALRKIGLSSCRVYLNGTNLLTWDDTKFDHFDPENTGSVVPIARTYNIGIKAAF